ncbi:MAG: hypothetical protein KIS92_24690, partial [Planctomycetota bacterium]|nr:hypothetical protein [Planctomycetota bacterium]
ERLESTSTEVPSFGQTGGTPVLHTPQRRALARRNPTARSAALLFAVFSFPFVWFLVLCCLQFPRAAAVP